MKNRFARVPLLVWILIITILLIGGTAFMQYRAASSAQNRYTTYAEIVQRQEQAAYLVGSPDNPVRQQLNLILSQTLVKSMTATERLKLAIQGEDLLKQSENQIDDIGALGDKANTAIAQMQVGQLGAFSSNDAAREVLALAKKRAAIIEDIRGLSYRANFETKQIFDRIIAEKGALTKEHIAAINEEIPSVEEQFNKRADLYTQLQATSAQIDRQSSDLKSIFSVSWKSAW